MVRAREKHPDLAVRVAEYLRRHGTASSPSLAERFLKMAVPSEEAATRILRAALEPHGLVYERGSGWSAAGSAPDASGSRLVAVAFDGSGEAPVLVEVRGDDAGEPSPPGAIDLEGATAILLEPRRDAIRLSEHLRLRRLAPPAGVASLRSAVRGGPRIPRRAGLDGICAVLGIRWNEGEDAAATARAMARCLARASAWRRNTADEDEEGELPGTITPETLDMLPESPGVYRFFDAEGTLLYVGKAANLRRRVRFYFGGRARKHGARFLSRIHRLEHEPLGSELEALLKESRLIARKRPAANVQLAVHERGRSYGKSRRQAILLPSGSSRVVTAVFVSDGRYAGHVPIGPRGGGMEKARRLLRQVMREANDPRRTGHDPDTEILSSWLARHADSVSRIDLDSFTSVGEAVDALSTAVISILAEAGAQVFRGS